MTAAASIIQVRQLFKSYETEAGKIHILKGITMQIQPGEVVSIMGPSGSGKSTLLGILGTLDQPTDGRILFEKKDVTSLSETELAGYRAHKIGFVFQSYNLISTMSALENVMLPMISVKGRSRRQMQQRAKELLSLVGMRDRINHLSSQLSGGQQQRVAIARAIANDPMVVIADEPTGNLDQKTGAMILDLIFSLRNKLNMSFILATHDPNVAGLSDRVIHLSDGKIVEEHVNQPKGE
ncbi:lipoprotein-releasing system ATP-binding protein LolD [Paenibacillus sambharensis]|uniref:Lipoprotein-releasing system ATP-binding protein LolD n=1 Tax=Paenibacillus sambharensis TaxID=1803190 RepID=A0A2W1LJS1_9BACL|nr:ABC transporter ATP-binding protein [Paenibacillus sambharensis]PZD94794.1 lipoprotein-releasing system ATP-binding protein LolD [Paenibacillus sambharensis]